MLLKDFFQEEGSILLQVFLSALIWNMTLVHNEERSLYFNAILVFVFLMETTMVN